MISFNKKRIGILIFIFLTLSVSLSSCGKTVKFNLSFIVDESVYAVIDTSGDEIVSMPQDPYKEGFIFDGWFWDKDKWLKPFTANSLLETPLSSDLKVYAKFIVANEEENPIIIKAEGFSMDGKTGYISVSNNDTIFSFIDKIQVSAGAMWQISTDIYGKDIIPTKTVSLDIGDNTYYLLVSSSDETNINLYTMIVRRKPIYKVEFNTNGGSNVDVQYVEEGGFIEEVTTQKLGYTFIKWDYDFLSSVNSDLLVSAIWEANRDTPYEVRYYLENLDGSVSEFKKERLEGTTDSIVYPEIKKVEHYYCGTPNVFGKVYPDGSLVLNIYYYRNEHSVNLTNENSDAGEIKGSGIYKHGEQVKISATTNEGYTWLGWYNGDELISADAEYSFVMDEQNYELTAKWVAYTVTTTTNDEEAGEFTAYTDKKVTVGDTVTLSATTNEGYTWLGWYSENQLVSLDLEYSFTMGENDCIFSAHWMICPVDIVVNDEDVIVVNGMPEETVIGQEIFLSARLLKLGYNFDGWFIEDELICNEQEYKITLTMDKTTYTVNCSLDIAMENFDFISDEESCKINGVKDDSVSEIIVPKYVTTIGFGAFSSCANLKTISLPFVGNEKGRGVNDYFGYIFGANNYNENIKFVPSTLTTVNILAGVEIDAFAFKDCSSIIDCSLPDGLERIESGAFSGCENLKNINIPDSIHFIDSLVFNNCNNLLFNEKDGSYYLGNEGNPYLVLYKVTDQRNFNFFGETKIIYENAFFGSDLLTKIYIPGTVLCIGNGAFAYCNNLSTIVIADGVRFINSLAFSNCISLTEIEIPKSIIQIESMAFRGCQGLLSITVEEGNLNYYSAGNCIIEKMTNKLIIGCNYSTIPLDDSVEQIGSFAFSSCSLLESLIVPVSLKEIQRYAFDECAALNIVYYLGTQKDWANIKIDSYENEAIINANIYFYSENLPTSSGNYWRYVNGVPTTW